MSDRTLTDLFEVIESRKHADKSTSYTATLFDAGLNKIAQKVGEEATETVIAALAEGPDKLTAESADLLYHLLVLWSAAGITPDEVFQELRNRHKPRDAEA